MHFNPICDKCSKQAALEDMRCSDCGGNLHFSYDESNPFIDKTKEGLDRFWSRLPIVNLAARVKLGEGSTPIVPINNSHGVNLFVKNEMGNPTGSHKDRQVSLAISHALQIGKTKSVLVSAGSTGLSNAAYAARAGIASTVFTGRNAREDRVVPISILGSKVIMVDEEIDIVIDELTDICTKKGIYNSSTARHINPYQAEGGKTISYEIYEQLGDAPEWMIVPAGGGGTYAAIARGFIELHKAKLTTKVPRIVGAVPASYNAIEHAFNNNYETMEQIKQHEIGKDIPTILPKLAHIHPPDAEDALRAARSVNGFFIAASDEESLDGCEYMASQVGLYTEPSSGTGVAVLNKFLASGQAKAGETVVGLLCGSGFRETNVYSEARPFNKRSISLSEMEAIASGE